MICVYPADCADFSNNGLGVVTPQSCTVTETLNGEWELTLAHPLDDGGKWLRLVEGNILRAPVPAAMTPRMKLVELSSGTLIYKVTSSNGRRLNLRTGPGTSYKSLGLYRRNTEVIVLNKTNDTWYEVTCPDGKRGYMHTDYLAYARTETAVTDATNNVVEQSQLRDQPFRIYRVVPDLNKVTVYARHIFYDQMENMIQNYSPSSTETGAAVVLNLPGKCLSENTFTYYSDLETTAEEVSINNKNPVEALLGDEGIVSRYHGELARDWFDVYVVQRVGSDTNVQIREKKNLLGVSYDVDISSVVTRIMPTGQDADGNALYLPELFLDSPHIDSYPAPKWIHLEVNDAKEVKKGDGKKTREQCYEEMRKAARAEFEAGCDLPTVTLKVDFINCASTVEYAQYAALQDVFLGDSVTVLAPRIGLSVSMRMTQYTYDCLQKKYTAMTLGTSEDTLEGNLISARQLAGGSITGSKLALNSVGTGQIQGGAVGAAQIQMAAINTAHIIDAAITNAKIGEAAVGTANIQNAAVGTAKIKDMAVTRAKIAEAAIGSAQIEDAAITRAKIGDAAIGSAQIDEGVITAAHIGKGEIQEAHIQDAAITTAKIQDAAVTRAKIGDAAIGTAQIEDAAITNAKIGTAAVGTANIQDATIITAKIQDAAITRAKIADLAVGSAQIDDLAVTTAKIAQAAITTAQIANAAVDTAQIALGAITAALIAKGAVGTAQIADASITDAKIVSLNADVITSGTLATERLIIRGDNGLIYEINAQASGLSLTELSEEKYKQQLNGTVIVARSITAEQIAAATITANEILAGTITGDKIAAATIEGSNIKAGTITTSHVSADFGEKLVLDSNKGIQLMVKNTEAAQSAADKAQETANKAVMAANVYYAVSSSSTVVPASGWSLTPPERADGQFIWEKTVTRYGDGSTVESKPVCVTGKDGESAVTVRIDSSRGTVFKNNAVSTVLTAVIYHGSHRITGMEELRRLLGPSVYLEWSWQRMEEDRFGIIAAGDTRIGNDGFTLTISPTAVDVKTVFLCELKD